MKFLNQLKVVEQEFPEMEELANVVRKSMEDIPFIKECLVSALKNSDQEGPLFYELDYLYSMLPGQSIQIVTHVTV